MSHTPGPWVVFEDCSKVAAHGARNPAIGLIGRYFTESITNDRGEFYNPEDAHLVAAAPDLLSALTAIVQSLADQDDEGMIEHAQQMINARAAIAKAKS